MAVHRDGSIFQEAMEDYCKSLTEEQRCDLARFQEYLTADKIAAEQEAEKKRSQLQLMEIEQASKEHWEPRTLLQDDVIKFDPVLAERLSDNMSANKVVKAIKIQMQDSECKLPPQWNHDGVNPKTEVPLTVSDFPPTTLQD